jgi:hypothetical protein
LSWEDDDTPIGRVAKRFFSSILEITAAVTLTDDFSIFARLVVHLKSPPPPFGESALLAYGIALNSIIATVRAILD